MRLRERVFCGALALLIAALGHATSSLAGEYEFTYSDTNGVAAQGVLTASNSGLGDGSLLVGSGTMTVISSPDSNASVGGYSIYPAGPTQTTSPNGAFYVDDLIFPNNNAGNNPQGFTPGYVTNDGLLFVATSGPALANYGGAYEANIWGNGAANNYSFWTANGGFTNGQPGNGTFTLQYVPEPSSLVLEGVAAALALGCGLRRRRQA